MEKLHLASEEPIVHEKIDEMVQIEAIAIEEGTWTDMYGRTLQYTPNALINSVKSFIGRPIVYPHTDTKNDMKKVVGIITEAWADKHNGKTAVFIRGLVHDDDVCFKILDGSLRGGSIEASYIADTSTNPPSITSLESEAFALTNRPACSTCVIQSYPKRVTTIKLEGGERKMSENKQINTEEALDKIANIVKEAYPMPKTKAWGDMTKEEKYGACMLFFKNAGYPIPYKYPKKTKDEISGKEVWDFPEGTPEELKNAITSLETEVTNLQAEVDRLKNEITKRDNDEVNRLFNEIKELDSDFDKESITKMSKCPSEQKVFLQSYLDNLKRLKPKWTVGPISALADSERADKICLEAFGMKASELEKVLQLKEGSK